MVMMSLLLTATKTYADIGGGREDESSEEEIAVVVNVQSVGSTEIPAFIQQKSIYLAVTDLFNFLKVKNTPSIDLDSISGFFLNPDNQFVIDKANNRITYEGNTFQLLPTDLIRTETNLYLKSDYFGKVFGLDCNFNFRSLMANITSRLELPVIREMRQEMMRKNLQNIQGKITADTSYKQSRPWFRFGVADWSLIATEIVNGQSQLQAAVNVGAALAGGELNVSVSYSTATHFNRRQQNYFWRYVDNDKKLFKQITLGKIITQATASLYAPVVGAQITNTPTTYRRSFGTYTINNTTQPGWVVELYVNNVLIAYTKADASGFYSFEVPLVYGSSQVKFRFYGPWGEELTKQENILIPFSFVPMGKLEYTLSGGYLEDGSNSRFARGVANYGLARWISVGGGVEYLSSITSGNTLPFLNTSMRLARGLLFSGEYTYGVRSRGILTYRLPSNMQIELNYNKYQPGQKAINFGFLEERKAILTAPIKYRNFSVLSRLTVNQIILPFTDYTSSELFLSSNIMGVSTSLTSFALFTQGTTNIYSTLALGIKLPHKFTLTPQAQYSYSTNKLLSYKLSVEKQLNTKGYLNLFYEQNFNSNIQNFGIDFRYDLNFAQVGSSARHTNNQTSFIQTARGSIINDAQLDYVNLTARPNIGRAAIAIVPFVDINGNKEKDPGEPRANGLKVKVNGGKVIISKADTCIRIIELEPYSKYLVELDGSSFDFIGWELKHKTLNVAVAPNQFKHIYLPISVVAEVTGTVLKQEGGHTKGLGQILLNLYDESYNRVARILSEQDGFYSYMGLRPGKYAIGVDTNQLHKLNMTATPPSETFAIKESVEGDNHDDIIFTLTSKQKEQPIIKETIAPVPEPIHQSGTYFIQTGAFKMKENAYRLQEKLSKEFGKRVEIYVDGAFYKVRIFGFDNYHSAHRFKKTMARKNYKVALVMKLP